MNAIVKRAPASVALFNPATMRVAFKKVTRSTAGDTAFLKMEKSGVWVFGAKADAIEDGQEFYVHPGSFVHGFVAWGDGNSGEKVGEVMIGIEHEIPPLPPTTGPTEGWQQQFGCTLVPVDGGTPLTYRTTSVGGKRLIGELCEEIASRLPDGENPNAPIVPVVSLDSEWYSHKKYGKVYNPLMPVSDWVSTAKLEALLDSGAPAKAAAAKKAPAKKAPAKPAGKTPMAKKVGRR